MKSTPLAALSSALATDDSASTARTTGTTLRMKRCNARKDSTLPSSHIGDAALVHLVEERRVLLLDDLALDLEARRQLAFIHRQVLRQDRELLDALVLRERLVDLGEIRVEQLLRFRSHHDVGVRLAVEAVLVRPLHRRFFIE